MEIILVGSISEELELLRGKLRSVIAGVEIAESNDTLTALFSPQTSLLFFVDTDIATIFLQEKNSILKTTPCLILLDNLEDLPPFISQYPSVDILDKGCSHEVLLHKVNHLLVQKQRLDDIASMSQKLENSDASIQQSLDLLEMITTRDGLTGMFNRRHFSKTFPPLFTASIKNDDDISLLLIDVDYFSQINRSAGQSYGDFILNELSARITSLIRPEDLGFRFGGGDFTVILPRTDIQKALKIANEIMSSCSEKAFTDGNIRRNITVSIGYASRVHNMANSHDELVAMAEMALFSAKSGGRNRIADYNDGQGYDKKRANNDFSTLKANLQRILEKTKRSTVSSLQLLSRDIVGQESKQHIESANEYAQLLCDKMNLPDSIASTFNNAIAIHASIRSMLHKEMLMKKRPLTVSERDILKELPFKLTELIDQFDYFAHERMVLQSYGEHFDGSGYPDGLQANEIPLAARIFNLVDAFAAMNADRPYRKKLEPEEIIQELFEGSGKQFDPLLVYKTLSIINQYQLLEIDEKTIEKAKDKLKDKFSDMIL